MTIHQDRQICRNFWAMKEGVRYCLTDRAWEQYQQARLTQGWGRAAENLQQDWWFERKQSSLFFQTRLVWDFALDPNPDAFALAFASNVALAFFALKPLGSPDPPFLSPEPIQTHPLSDLMDFEGSLTGFWNERTHISVAAEQASPSSSTFSLHLDGLSEANLARLLTVVRQMQESGPDKPEI